MLSEVAVLLPADGAGGSELVVHVVDVPLQVGLQIAAVATLCALEVFNLQVEVLVEVLLEVEGGRGRYIPACAAG